MKTPDRPSGPAKPSLAVSVAIFVSMTALMACLRLSLFRHQYVALTYGLPLLLCLWHRDRRLLWSMAATFVGMSAIKAFWLLPDPDPSDFAETTQWLMQVANILAIGGAVDAILRLTDRLQKQNASLVQANEELTSREHEIKARNEELRAQGEELAQQNEELQQQGEELHRQNEELQQASEELGQQAEELQAQAEELRTANQELNAREAMLQMLLVSLSDTSNEQQVLSRVCQALLQLAGAPAVAAAVVEKVEDQLVVRMQAGAEKLRRDRWPLAHSFASLVMAQDQTGFVDDLAARPDLIVPEPAEHQFRSILATPLRVHAQCVGAVEVYSLEARQWTKREFHIIEWAAAKCSLVLEIMRLQEALRQSEAAAQTQRGLLQVVVNHLPAAVTVIRGSDLRIQLINPAYQAIAPGKEMPGKTLDELWPETGRAFSDLCRQVLTSGVPHQAVDEPFMISRSTGGPLEQAFFSWSLYRVRLPGEEGWAILNTAWETTARKRVEDALRASEEQLRLAAQAANIGIWSWKPGTSHVVVSANWRSLFGVGPDVAVTFETWRDAILPEDRERAVRELSEASDQHREFNSEYRVPRPDGSIRWIVDRGRAWYDEHGRAIGMAGVNVDITDQKQAQQILARGKEELERVVADRTAKLQEMVNELEHFSYTITHDMRAPLRAMQGYSDLLCEECAGCGREESNSYAKRIATAARRMDALITDALNYSRAVRQELALTPVDAAALLRGMLDSYPEFHMSKAQIEIQGEIPLVLGNEAGLTQCFSNLLDNAVKFTKPGQKPHIRIWAEVKGQESEARSQEPGVQGTVTSSSYRSFEPSTLNPQLPTLNHCVRLWIEDDGIGIPAMMLPRVFDMFARGHSGQAGTGIGLALVRKVMDRMAGRVGVESEQGKGSRFWLELEKVQG